MAKVKIIPQRPFPANLQGDQYIFFISKLLFLIPPLNRAILVIPSIRRILVQTIGKLK